MEPGALDVLTAWVTALTSASWCQAGSLALVTLLVGMGLTFLVTCVGEDVVQEGGGWVVFATVHLLDALAGARVPSTSGDSELPSVLLLPTSSLPHPRPATCSKMIQIPFSHLLSSQTQGSVEQLGGMGLN